MQEPRITSNHNYFRKGAGSFFAFIIIMHPVLQDSSHLKWLHHTTALPTKVSLIHVPHLLISVAEAGLSFPTIFRLK